MRLKGRLGKAHVLARHWLPVFSAYQMVPRPSVFITRAELDGCSDRAADTGMPENLSLVCLGVLRAVRDT
ncbi:hypothetical protein NDU88_012268 [Pleurodeles waltl]|uniref:Uncharacterized protein n=1 Tax=Pleurodeles waltl TaxID=8319 RepID=A0AAV7R5P9_PLEWA|nr:hypothetical protein NDU88_012268 [Pleurodeles waltl]